MKSLVANTVQKLVVNNNNFHYNPRSWQMTVHEVFSVIKGQELINKTIINAFNANTLFEDNVRGLDTSFI